jgi:hypothetical protein
MKKQKKSAIAKIGQAIKLKVDARTTIIVRSKEALKMWLGKYPKAVVVKA